MGREIAWHLVDLGLSVGWDGMGWHEIPSACILETLRHLMRHACDGLYHT